MEKRSPFRVRSFISVLIGISALVLVITGAVLFIVPPGRIANWGGWSFLGLTKDRWQALHMVFALVFVVVSGLHIFYNWRPLVSYFRRRPRMRMGFRWEWVGALVLVVLVVAATIGDLPPFSTVLAVHEDIKESWDRRPDRAPVPHAELMTIEELSTRLGMSAAEMIENLEARGIPASADQKLEDIARSQEMTPQALYAIAAGAARRGEGRGRTGGRLGGWGGGRGSSGSSSVRGGGRGVGRMSLGGLCAEEGLDLEAVLGELQIQAVEATSSTRVRELADRMGVHPRDLAASLRALVQGSAPAEEPAGPTGE